MPLARDRPAGWDGAGAPPSTPAPGPGRALAVLAALVALAALGTAVSGAIGAAASPTPGALASAAASATPVAATTAPPSPAPSLMPSPSPEASPSSSPSPSAGPWLVTAVDGAGASASRVAVPALRIDLPVVRPKTREKFPLCNVAEYLVPFAAPGTAGITYLYAHARTGMFLPLLTSSKVRDGRGMIGMDVSVWTGDARRYAYRIVAVHRHVSGLSIPAWVFKLPPNTLILQTSETPYATGTKLFVVAYLLAVAPSTPAEANPVPHPLVCA